MRQFLGLADLQVTSALGHVNRNSTIDLEAAWAATAAGHGCGSDWQGGRTRRVKLSEASYTSESQS